MPPVSSRTTSRSVPSIRSRRSGEASYSAGSGLTGRRLAYRPRPLRRPSRPCSGRGRAGSVVSHRGPPTAASSTASERLQASSTSSVRGVPCTSIEAPPNRYSSNSKSPSCSSSSSVGSMISGPIPSPGRVTMRYATAADATSCSQRGGGDGPAWRESLLAVALEVGDRGLLLECESNVVEPAEQPMADLVVDLEGEEAPVEAHLLLDQVDLALAGVGQAAAVLGSHHDGQQTDLGAVGVEDVGEARRDDRLKAVVLQAPGCVLARGAAAEVLTGHQDRVGRQLPARLLGPVVEQELAEAGALDALEELLGHDLVGVHVGAIEVADLA